MTSSDEIGQSNKPKFRLKPSSHAFAQASSFNVGNSVSNERALPSVQELFSGENWFNASLAPAPSSSTKIEPNSSRIVSTGYIEADRRLLTSDISDKEINRRISGANTELSILYNQSFTSSVDQRYEEQSSSEDLNEVNSHPEIFIPPSSPNPNSMYLGQPNYVSKRHICHLCNKRFPRPSSLRVHLNTHTGEKPYICEYPNCHRSFSVLSNLRRHSKTHSS